MSRSLPVWIVVFVVFPTPTFAQDIYGPSVATAQEVEPALPEVRANPCETEAQEDGVILVCRELEDQERYRSPIPREVQSDRHMIPGLNDPPCWVTNPSAVGTPACVRMGWVPPRAIIVDVTAFPEPLSEEDAARVTAIDEEAAPIARVGERIAIDLSEDD